MPEEVVACGGDLAGIGVVPVGYYKKPDVKGSVIDCHLVEHFLSQSDMLSFEFHDAQRLPIVGKNDGIAALAHVSHSDRVFYSYE